MNTRANHQRLSIPLLAALSALLLMLAACGEQTGEQQQSDAAPTAEQPSEGTTQ